MEYKNNLYVESLKDLSSKDIFPGVTDVLRKLKEQNILIAIGSSSKNAKTILKQIGLIDEFDFISDGNMIERGKPFPDVFKIVSDSLKIEPEKCLVVEDAVAGLQAAKAAKMDAVGISTASNSSLADYSLNKITDLLDVVK